MALALKVKFIKFNSSGVLSHKRKKWLGTLTSQLKRTHNSWLRSLHSLILANCYSPFIGALCVLSMDDIEIKKVEILNTGEITVLPTEIRGDLFPYVYRVATGVVWNESSGCFSSPVPREWSHLDWYKNILASVQSELGINLKVSSATKWQNIETDLQQQIRNYVT